MNDKIIKIKNFRLFLLKQIEALSVDQLNHIPSGFNNNIIWNIGHMTSAQQTMCYIRSGVPVIVEDRFFQPFISGTKPEKKFDESEIKTIKELFIATVDRLQTDLDANVFQNYSPSIMIPKVYGFEVTNIESAIEYLLHHEGFHAGYIHALKHVLQSLG